MHSRNGLLLVTALMALALMPVQADTIILKNGVRFDGTASPVPDQEGLFKVTAGKRQLFYRETEIDHIEKNDRTGLLDKNALLARWEERNRQLTEETGLTVEQRRLVRGLMFELKSEDESKRISVREKLKVLQAEFDAYGYIASIYRELSPLLAPNVLYVLTQLDPRRTVPLLQESAQSNYFAVRAIALELLGGLRHKDSAPIIARGLADFSQPVQISAAYALADMGVRQYTPALVSLLANADLRVSGASRESLTALWSDKLGDKRLNTVSEWDEFWKAQTLEGTPVGLAQLEPLSSEEEELKQTIDSNN